MSLSNEAKLIRRWIKAQLDKWLDHIPLERQCRILECRGFVVTSQTLWGLAYAVTQ